MRRFALLIALLTATVARGDVLGGGDATKDCRLVFGGLDATAGQSGVVCTDGDPTCDDDGVPNGVCRVTTLVCIGPAVGGCTPVEIDRIESGGSSLALPAVPAASGCGVPNVFDVPVGAPALAVTLRGYRKGELGEVDYLNVCCVADGTPLAASRCAVDIDPGASGCTALPDGAGRKLARAGALLDQALGNPGKAARFERRAAKQMKKLRRIGQKIAARDDCGFALGLMATHAEETLRDAAAGAP